MMKLLIAVDGSDPARRAIEAAANLAKQGVGVEATLVHVRESPAYYGELPPFDFESIESGLRQRQSALLEAALTHARNCGLQTVTAQATQGQAAQEIARLAADIGADFIVMGTRGMNALGGLLLGSVAQRVVHLATVPVMMVK